MIDNIQDIYEKNINESREDPMELHQIECFLELSKFQNVSLTAERLNISQPALSKTISLLESELGVKLFDRVGRRIILNERGKMFALYAEQGIKNLRFGADHIKKLEYQPVGTISLGLFSYIGLISQCICDFLSTFKQTKFEIFSSKTQYTIDHFDNLDFTLSSSLSPMEVKQESILQSIDIGSEKYILVAAPELLDAHHVQAKGCLPLSSLSSLPFLAMANNLMFSDITCILCQQAGFSPNLVVETNDFATKLHMTSMGVAAAFIPEVCIPTFRAVRSDFCFLDLCDIENRRVIRLGRKKSSAHSQVAQAFWDYAVNWYHADLRDGSQDESDTP